MCHLFLFRYRPGWSLAAARVEADSDRLRSARVPQVREGSNEIQVGERGEPYLPSLEAAVPEPCIRWQPEKQLKKQHFTVLSEL